MATKPIFVPVARACELLGGISRSQLQRLYPYLPHLYIPTSQTRRFPEQYLLVFVAYAKPRNLPLDAANARIFAGTRDAKRLIWGLPEGFEHELLRQLTLSTNEIAQLLNVDESTIGDWMRNGQLKPINPDRRPNEPFVFPVAQLRRTIEWRLPAR